ncbi:hypothetical protein [Tianweitania sediminis]|uniref:Uncharacterized protein n=1 Tax=Tianweitania sediminis TaxID=1502156 RepID=A0A8J7UMK1_9HYPH|nr:hypothetical protein [Tianweitania sediminis]MBP0440452.1 hypothetical protein [Tianweitania sediminis]
MARKAFFAAFIIDEGAYTPEPGPVDNHFIAADLAQSNFGTQSGVSHIVVWDSADGLIAEHQQRGPITVDYLLEDGSRHDQAFPHTPEACPSRHWNRGDDICADCGADLNVLTPDAVTPTRAPSFSFRDHLSPTMRDTLAFEYYEVRPCLERDHQVRSFRDEDAFNVELSIAQKEGREFRVFWSLYGVDRNTATAIGDFVSKDAAHETMNAILAIPAGVRNALQDQESVKNANCERLTRTARVAAEWLDDMINQSSNHQRI